MPAFPHVGRMGSQRGSLRVKSCVIVHNSETCENDNVFWVIVIMFVEIILFFENNEFSFGIAHTKAFPGGGRCRGGADINGIIYTLPPRRMRSSLNQ